MPPPASPVPSTAMSPGAASDQSQPLTEPQHREVTFGLLCRFLSNDFAG